MTSVFYRVRRTVDGKRQWIKHAHGLWTDDVAYSDSWLREGAAEQVASDHGGTVITVRHKLIPAKPRTHDRAWALRQLAKGRAVTNGRYFGGYMRIGAVHGLEYVNRDGRVEGVISCMVFDDGYTLWQEPAK